MPEYDESGFKFYLEDECSFRFEKLESYKKGLGNSGVKEMDFAWVDGSGALMLLEAESKGAFPRFVKQRKIEKCPLNHQRDAFLDYLAAKATDSLLMLAATWIPTDYGEKINNETPTVFSSQSTQLRISVNFFLVGAGNGELIALRKELSRKLAGKLRLLDSEKIAVYGNAEKAGEKLGIRIEKLQR